MRNKRKNLFSKWMAFCLTLIMAITMALPVQAAVTEGDKYTITVTGTSTDAGATVTAYQIMEANYDFVGQQAKDPLYKWVGAVAEWLKKDETYKNYVSEDNEVTDTFAKATDGDRSTLMNDMEDAISAGSLNLNATKTAKIDSNTYKAEFTEMPIGGYLLSTTPDSEGKYKDYVYAPMTANLLPVYNDTEGWVVEDAEVALKGNPISIDKTAEEHDVAIGDVVKYTLHVPVPNYPDEAEKKIFRIGDTLPNGITFAEEIENNNLQVYAVSQSGNQSEITAASKIFTYHHMAKDLGLAGVDDTPEQAGEGVITFILDFNYNALMNQYNTDANGPLKEIKVTYQGIVNENALEGGDSLKNTAYVGKNDPYNNDNYVTSTDDEKVYTYKIEITKVEKGSTTKLLSGAEFKLFTSETDANKDENAINFVEIGSKNGQYRKTKAEEAGVTKLVVGEKGDRKGKLNLDGLATGTYYLKETKAPDGYELLKNPIAITLTDAQVNTGEEGAGILDKIGDADAGTPVANIFYQTVENSEPPIMPVTGGMGTILFTIVGVVLVAGGLTLIVTYMRRRHS